MRQEGIEPPPAANMYNFCAMEGSLCKFVSEVDGQDVGLLLQS